MNLLHQQFPQNNSSLPHNRLEYKDCIGLKAPDRILRINYVDKYTSIY